MRKNFIFVNLESQTEGAKPFDGMAAGTFTDMWGRSVTFKKEDLKTYIKNTQAALESTRDSAGNIVGLPIDSMNHDNGIAAGWVVAISEGEGGEKISFTPRWNDVGLGLISGDVMRFFSPTVDIKNKVIMGGSLTNWPATRTDAGQILLKPIELSAHMFELTEEGLVERANRVAKAFYNRFSSDMEGQYSYPVDVFEDYIIVEQEDQLYRVPYTESSEGIEFAEHGEWIKVKRSYVEAAMKEFRKWISGLFQAGSNVDGDEPTTDLQGDETMPKPTDQVLPDVSALTAEQTAALETVVEQRAQLRFQGWLEQEKRKGEIIEFSRGVVGKGLPVEEADLCAFLSSLTAESFEQAKALFSKIADTGNIDFAEHGHSKTLTNAQPLPGWAKAELTKWLAAGYELAGFFTANAVELGNQSDYDLKEFEQGDK